MKDRKEHQRWRFLNLENSCPSWNLNTTKPSFILEHLSPKKTNCFMKASKEISPGNTGIRKHRLMKLSGTKNTTPLQRKNWWTPKWLNNGKYSFKNRVIPSGRSSEVVRALYPYENEWQSKNGCHWKNKWVPYNAFKRGSIYQINNAKSRLINFRHLIIPNN